MKLDRELKNPSGKKTGSLAVSEPVKAASKCQLAPGRPAQSIQNQSKAVTIKAKIDVGFGNTLYVRGEGQGLSWNQGIPLTCVDNSTWKWSGETDDKLKFKLLLNDSIWSKGEDLVAAPGDKVEVAPAF